MSRQRATRRGLKKNNIHYPEFMMFRTTKY